MPSSKLLLLALVAAASRKLTLAIPVDNSGDVYSGDAGRASGGDVENGGNILHQLIPINILSGDAGSGGTASSGDALGGIVGLEKGQGSGGSDNNGNGYSGNGGEANGGSVTDPGGLINIASNNAGSGGDAGSGDVYGGGIFGGDDNDSDNRNHYHSHNHEHEHGGDDCYVCAARRR